MSEDTQKGWFQKLMNRFQSLMQQLDVPDEVVPEIRAFLMQVAKEQYMVGNSSGIRWARTNPQKSMAV